jgi:hypothetical protein
LHDEFPIRAHLEIVRALGDEAHACWSKLPLPRACLGHAQKGPVYEVGLILTQRLHYEATFGARIAQIIEQHDACM